jgi:hypothetical protein
VTQLRLIIGAIILALAVSGFAYVQHLRTEAARQKAKAAVATEQAASTGEALRQVDHYTHETQIIRERSDAAVQTVQAQPEAATALPDGLLAAWRSGIDGMRGKSPQAVPDRP